MQRFFLPSSAKKGDTVTIIDKNTVNQICKVMRSEVGDKIICLFNDGNEYEAELQEFSKKEVIAHVIQEIKNTNELSKSLVLFQAMPKSKDKWELVVQKAVELGVSTIVPLQSSRVTAKYPAKSERIERIIQEASEQSERGKLLEITDLCKLEELENYLNNDGLYFVGDSYDKEVNSMQNIVFELKSCSKLDQNNYSKNEERNSSKKELYIYTKTDLENCSNFGVFIGPEGGFAQEEIQSLNKKGVISVSLGKRILRLETAAIVSLGILGGLCD